MSSCVDIVSERPARRGEPWPAGWHSVLTHTHTFSGRADHGGPVAPPESYERLAAWTASLGIAALAMGSPYTPASAATYERFDGPERERYYAPGFDQHGVLGGDEIATMLARVNGIAGARTRFYLDNETPKGRYGHMWWVGYHLDVPAWHDYDQPFDRWMLEKARPDEYADEPMRYARRPYLEVVASQRRHGALGVWAHPTSWWPGDARQFVTNIATEMPAHAMADGYLDGLVVMGYQPHRPEYQSVWFALLDRGCRVPGVAEMDCGLSDPALWAREFPLLTYCWLPAEHVSVEAISAALRDGRVFASSGPFVDLTVDGQPMGSVAFTGPVQAHVVRITALPRPGGGPLDRLELVGRGGEVLWSRAGFTGGTVDLRLRGLTQRGYVLCRAVSADTGCGEWRQPSQVAVGSPVYLHPRGQGFAARATTRARVTVRPSSAYGGGELRFEAADGALLGTARAASGTLTETLPASGRVTVVGPDGRRRTDYLLNANRALQDCQRYLYRGRFLRDFPTCRPGEVPVDAWRLDDYAAALQAVALGY